MAFKSAQVARVCLAGLALTSYTRDVAPSSTTAMLDVTTLADTARQFIPGMTGGEWQASGFLDDGSQPYTRLSAYKGGALFRIPVAVFPLGDEDSSGFLFECMETSVDVSTANDGVAEWAASGVGIDRVDMAGTILENNTTVTADGDGTIHDNGAATSNGAVFHLHVTAFSGFTSDVITVEGSTNGSWAGEETTVATFSTINAAGFAIAPYNVQTVTGTVPRYLRVVDNVTGTGSITRFVAVSRR